MKLRSPYLSKALAACALSLAAHGVAQAAAVTFTQLSGITGGSPAGTGVYRADLSGLGLGLISSISILDSGSGIGGAGGRFSGFDLDAVVISTVLITDASSVGTLTPAATLDFASSLLVAGLQRAPADPALFGTAGGQVDNVVATLASFDGNSTTDPSASGFVSLGDGGRLSINLLSPIPIGTPLYLYIGEVGNNGEVAASSITVSDSRVPEPGVALLMAAGLLGLALASRKIDRRASAEAS